MAEDHIPLPAVDDDRVKLVAAGARGSVPGELPLDHRQEDEAGDPSPPPPCPRSRNLSRCSWTTPCRTLFSGSQRPLPEAALQRLRQDAVHRRSPAMRSCPTTPPHEPAAHRDPPPPRPPGNPEQALRFRTRPGRRQRGRFPRRPEARAAVSPCSSSAGRSHVGPVGDGPGELGDARAWSMQPSTI